jgi:2-dehydropantoate 2-reductase
MALMEETITAPNQSGYALTPDVLEEQIKRTETMDEYRPSTLLDWETGRPLEIEAIWGEPLRRASAAGALTPRLEIVYALLKALDGARRPS